MVGPPVRGADWWAVNACCELSAHRGAMIALNGRINGAERYAIDRVRVDFAVTPFFDPAVGLLASVRGDPEQNQDYLAYGEPLLAVRHHLGRAARGTPTAVPR